jgi:hypothetical protein
MAGKASWSYVDYDMEVGTVSVNCVGLTAENFDAQETLRAALHTALTGVTLGSLFKYEKGNQTLASKSQPGDENAQRESKWLVMFEDNVTFKQYSFEIPCADLSLLKAEGKEMDISAGAGASLVSAIEAYVLSVSGNSVTVQRVVHVGRNV